MLEFKSLLHKQLMTKTKTTKPTIPNLLIHVVQKLIQNINWLLEERLYWCYKRPAHDLSYDVCTMQESGHPLPLIVISCLSYNCFRLFLKTVKSYDSIFPNLILWIPLNTKDYKYSLIQQNFELLLPSIVHLNTQATGNSFLQCQ